MYKYHPTLNQASWPDLKRAGGCKMGCNIHTYSNYCLSSVTSCHCPGDMYCLCYSENGELQMILKSGRLQVEHIRQRRIYIFHVGTKKDWCIRYTKLSEHPIPLNHTYGNDAVVDLGNGYDNKELEVRGTIIIGYYM